MGQCCPRKKRYKDEDSEEQELIALPPPTKRPECQSRTQKLGNVLSSENVQFMLAEKYLTHRSPCPTGLHGQDGSAIIEMTTNFVDVECCQDDLNALASDELFISMLCYKITNTQQRILRLHALTGEKSGCIHFLLALGCECVKLHSSDSLTMATPSLQDALRLLLPQVDADAYSEISKIESAISTDALRWIVVTFASDYPSQRIVDLLRNLAQCQSYRDLLAETTREFYGADKVAVVMEHISTAGPINTANGFIHLANKLETFCDTHQLSLDVQNERR